MIDDPQKLVQMHLEEMRRILAQEKVLAAEKQKHQAAVMPLLKAMGSYRLTDPKTGETVIAGVREPKTAVCDANELFEALLAHYGDEDLADVIWKDTLKAPEVDVKEDGRLQQSVARHEKFIETGDGERGVPIEVFGEVVRYKEIKASVGWSTL